MQVGDPLAHRQPALRRLGLAFGRPEGFERPSIVDRGLDPEHAGLLVVHLDRVVAETMLDAPAFRAGLHVAHQIGLEQRRHAAGGRDLAAEKAHHVGAEKPRQAVLHQPRIEPRKPRRIAEQNVAGRFALVGRPVAVHRECPEHRVMGRVQALRNSVQQLRPGGPHLAVHPTLRPRGRDLPARQNSCPAGRSRPGPSPGPATPGRSGRSGSRTETRSGRARA